MSENQNGSPYFPPLYGSVDCGQCENTECWCRGKYQRSRRDFTHTSGRCPRLPDERGFVEETERKLYAETFPLVCAERSDSVLHLTLMIPGSKRPKKVYLAKSGTWYFNEKNEFGSYSKRALTIESFHSREGILGRMDSLYTDYCLFRATIEDYFV